MLPAFSVAFGTMRANPLRTLLSTIGVIMGAAALVAVLSVGDGLERYTRAEILRTTGLHFLALQPRTAVQVDGQRLPTDDYPRFTLADLHELEPRLDGARRAVLQIEGLAYTRASDTDSMRVLRLTGLAGTMPADSRPPMVSGRHLTPLEFASSERLVEVSEALAGAIGAKPAALVGDSLQIGNGSFLVVGVFAVPEQSRELEAFAPFEVAEPSLAPTRQARAAEIHVEGARVEDVERLRDSTERWIAEHRPEWSGRVSVFTNRARLEQVSRGMLLFKLFMGTITGIALLVGGVGIMNVLLASIAERTREIGVRKATGARNRDILVQFLVESVTISSTGALVGALIGVAGAFGSTAIMRARTEAIVYASLSLSTIAVVATAALGIGLIFGMYPAVRASRLSPIDAIRQES